MVSLMNIHGSSNRTSHIRRLLRIVRLVNTLDDLYQALVLINPLVHVSLINLKKARKQVIQFSV